MGSWTTWFLGFNKRGVWIKRGGAKFGQFLINVVPEITELWVENSQETNCRDVTSIRKGRAVTGKTPFFVIGPFCIHHFICLIAGFWYDSFTWKLCVFNLNTFNKNLFQKVCFKVKSIENVQNFRWLSHKNMLVSRAESYFQNPWYRRTYAIFVGFKMKCLTKRVFQC